MLQLLNGQARDGLTPLMAACAAGSAECVRLLLAAGANASAPGGPAAPDSCLHIAAARGSVEIIDLLLGDESHVLARTADGRRRETLLRNTGLPCPAGGHYRVSYHKANTAAPCLHGRHLARLPVLQH